MTRIAGIHGGWPHQRSQRSVERMLGHFSAFAPHGSIHGAGRAMLGVASARATPPENTVTGRGPALLVIDGCLFNTAELSRSVKPDGEIFLDLYEQHGFREALCRVNGDFAIALYDQATDTLWLGRDRIGVRPLYYATGGDFFAFASQPGALPGLPGISAAVNRRFAGLFAGSHYRTFDNAREESPFADIRQLPAAHLAEIRSGGAPRLAQYWTLSDQGSLDLPEAELADRYRDLLVDAVRIRLSKAAKPAFLLSGGMDSSSVLASAVRVSGAKQEAFSSVYDDRTYDESEDIRSMLDSTVSAWHPVRIGNPDVFAIIERMVRVHDEPVATATWLSHYLLCAQAARQGFATLFGGLGGDELNAGEYEHFFFHFADLRYAGDEQGLRREVEHWARHHDHPIYRKNMAVVDAALERIVDLRSPGLCRPDRTRLDRYASAVNRGYFDVGSFEPVMDRPFDSYLRNRTFHDIFRETAPCCLRAEDRQTGAFGLQHFDPFFDYRLVEFMFRVPGRMKIRDGVTKILLREATRGLLPEQTRTRIKKTGWNAPAHVWFSGNTLGTLRDLTASRAFRERGIYDTRRVTALLDEHEQIVSSGEMRDNHMMFLWQLVNLELWLRTLDDASAHETGRHQS